MESEGDGCVGLNWICPRVGGMVRHGWSPLLRLRDISPSSPHCLPLKGNLSDEKRFRPRISSIELGKVHWLGQKIHLCMFSQVFLERHGCHGDQPGLRLDSQERAKIRR